MMPRQGPLQILLCLLSLLAVAVFLGGQASLLMFAPFLLLFGVLLVGLYPGERVLEVARRVMAMRPRATGRVRLLLKGSPVSLRQLFLKGHPGSRGPPVFA